VLAGAILVFGRPVWLLIFVVIIPFEIRRAGKESVVLEAAFMGRIIGDIGRGRGFDCGDFSKTF